MNLNNIQQNHLASEKSPYLLQHASNPVDWYPWGDEAFERAKKEDKPIFLSIGYSTCHWCHVMEHESFEDGEVAQLLNDSFINIKVDREERPDIDNIYMTVCQLLTGGGGWPLSIIMTPDKKPFFAATYIPKETKLGNIGLMELIPKILTLWKHDRGKINEASNEISAVLIKGMSGSDDFTLNKTVLTEAFSHFGREYDMRYGGFGDAPKFPTPHNLLFLLRYWHESRDGNVLKMVVNTLKKMRMGGMYDHIGYGFHRYSTDKEWLVPHFEKMLYDQALLAMAYLEAYQATGDEYFSTTAREIFTYVLRDMVSEEGGFFSAEDADSEGVEGKFYVWSEDEIREILSPEDADLAVKHFNIQKEGNFFEESTRQKTGDNIIHLNDNDTKLADEYSISYDELVTMINNIRQILFKSRVKRIHPQKDDKILTDWNGLMIAALAMGARILDENFYLIAAEKAMNFIFDKMLLKDYRLLHRYRDGEAAIHGNLDDYSFVVWALLELYESTFKTEYLNLAINLSESINKYFEDKESGGYFFTPDYGEQLIARTIQFYDGATPSGNSVVFYNIIRLNKITADIKWEMNAEKLLSRASGFVKRFPAGHTMLMLGLQMLYNKSYEIVISGNMKDSETRKIISKLREYYIPNKTIVLNPNDENGNVLKEIALYLKDYKMIDDKVSVYICQDHKCSKPVTNINDVEKLLHLDRK